MPLEQIHISQDYANRFPEVVLRLDPEGDRWIELDKIVSLGLEEQVFLFTDLYRQPDYFSLDFNYWKTCAGLNGERMDKIGNLLWATDAKTAVKMKVPRNQRPIKLAFPIFIEPPYHQMNGLDKILDVALQTVLQIGPPSGRPDPFAKQILPFVPQWESVAIVFTTQKNAVRAVPAPIQKELSNGTFDAFSIGFSGEEGPILMVFLIGDRMLTHDSELPGRFCHY